MPRRFFYYKKTFFHVPYFLLTEQFILYSTKNVSISLITTFSSSILLFLRNLLSFLPGLPSRLFLTPAAIYLCSGIAFLSAFLFPSSFLTFSTILSPFFFFGSILVIHPCHSPYEKIRCFGPPQLFSSSQWSTSILLSLPLSVPLLPRRPAIL